VTQVLDCPKVDDAAVAAVLEGLRDRGATCQVYIRAGGTNVCINAVNAGRDGWSEYSEAASRRAATGGRRMLPVLGSGEVDARFWIAYDVGSARSLADHRARGLLPTSTSQRVLSDVARALDEAAAKGLFASELPPDSVFVTEKGARLGDLGTAREGLAGAKLALEGDPAYVPPEVLRGERAGERAGVYLFGALLQYLLTGAAPQRGGSSPRQCLQPDLPASIKAIVAVAMADDPDSRPHTVSEANAMAERALRGEPPARGRRRRAATAGPAKRAIRKAATAGRATTEPAAAKRATTEPAAAKRATTEPAPTKRATTEPAPTKRATTEPATAKHATTKPATAKHATTEPATAKHATTEPATAKRATTEPATAKRAIRKAATAKRATSQPATAKRAIRKAATAKRATSQPATAKPAIRKPAIRKPAIPKPATAKRATSQPATAKRATFRATAERVTSRATAAKRAISRAAGAKRALRKVPTAKRVIPKLDAAQPLRRVGALSVTRRHALGVGGALVLGAAAGLLLGTSPDPEPARAKTVTAGGLSVTLPSGPHRVEARGKGLAIRSPGSLLRARMVSSPLPPSLDARPVRLGPLQAWRHSAGGEVRYSVPTSRGTLAVTCRVTASASSRPLRLCERTASTLRLRDARALPLATVVVESRRVQTTVAALEAERDAARARLGSASTSDEQRLAAQDLADSHERAASVLRELAGAGSVEAAARGAADAYSRLAAAAESGSAERWDEASEQVRRSDAALAEAVAAAP
jgi:hypothetical protein